MAEWALSDANPSDLAMGYFGMGVGAPAVLVASLQRPPAVAAIVCYNGAVELASNLLADIRPPVLFLVGAREPVLRRTSEGVVRNIRTGCRLAVVPELSPVLTKAGVLDLVVWQARAWFAHHRRAVSGRGAPSVGATRNNRRPI